MIGKSIRWVAGLAVTAVVVVMVGVLLVPRAFGLEPYVVTSGSMRPTFEPGAVVLAEQVQADALRAGDIVTFRTDSGVTTHRVVERRVVGEGADAVTTYETRGDANNASDGERLDSRNVLGKVRYGVAGVGYLLEAVRSPLGITVLIALFGVVLFTGGRKEPAQAEESAEELERPTLEVVR